MCTFARILFDRLDVDICLLYVHICRRKYPKELPQANYVCALIPSWFAIWGWPWSSWLITLLKLFVFGFSSDYHGLILRWDTIRWAGWKDNQSANVYFILWLWLSYSSLASWLRCSKIFPLLLLLKIPLWFYAKQCFCIQRIQSQLEA